MFLFFDTETSGFINEHLPITDRKQCRIVQLGAVLTDEELNPVTTLVAVFKPSTFDISKGAAEVHGITQERAYSVGVEPLPALRFFNQLIQVATKVIAYNASFDRKVFHTEMQVHGGIVLIPDFKVFCPMHFMTDICKLPKKNGRAGYKWPKLEEAFEFCYKKPMEHAHDALADVDATISVCRWIKQKGFPGTPFAK